MKNIILVLTVLVSTFSTSLGSVTPESELSLISSEKVELTMVNVDQKGFFQVAQYNNTLDALDFVTKDYVTYIQIYTQSGELQYQLPVMSNKVKISRKIFEEGAYKIAFLTKDKKSIQFTNLTVN